MKIIDRIYIIGMIVFIFLFIVFLIISKEEIILNNKLNESYIKIYEDDNNIIYSKYVNIKYKTRWDKEYELSEALNKNIITIDSIGVKSNTYEEKEDSCIFYFNNKSKIKINNEFKIVICKNIKREIYIIGKEENIICNKN